MSSSGDSEIAVKITAQTSELQSGATAAKAQIDSLAASSSTVATESGAVSQALSVGVSLRSLCPNLNDGNHQVTSAATPLYNCVAWAARNNLHYIWPDADEQYGWPPQVPRAETVAAFVSFFSLLGFVHSATSEFQNGYEKIAIYTRNGIPTHCARQLEDGSWTSKLGDLADIAHSDVESVEGGIYGTAAYFMQRGQSPVPPPLPRLHPGPGLVTTAGVPLKFIG